MTRLPTGIPLTRRALEPRVTIDTDRDAYSDQILSEYRRPDISRYFPDIIR